MTRFKHRIASAAIVAIVGLAACSSSSSSRATVAPDTPVATTATSAGNSGSTAPTSATTSPTIVNSASTPSAASATPAVSAGTAAATDLATKGCTAIKIADAQALFTAAVTKIDFTAGSAELDAGHQFTCEFSGQPMLITIDPLDASKQIYQQDVTDQRGSDHPLPGVGDTAVWAGPVLSDVVTSAPTVIAHKGSVTCKVESAGGPGLTIPVDTGPLGGSTVAEAEAFATETGALCNDIFAAIA